MPNEPIETTRYITTAADVANAARRIYKDPLTSSGILHVTAVWQDSTSSLITLEINPDTPRCEHDTLVLAMARARADAIITTGKILRSEPSLRLDLVGSADVPKALLSWRHEYLAKADPPWGLVLTSGRDLDIDHPFFTSWARPVIYTSQSGFELLHRSAEERGIEVVSAAEPSLCGALAWLRDERAARTISIEAGPSTSLGLYEPPELIDEVLLSIFEAPELSASVRGRPFLALADLQGRFPHRSAGFRVATADGTWRFLRFFR